jgi:hypothetical protein
VEADKEQLQIRDVGLNKFRDYVYFKIKLQMSKTSGGNLSYIHYEPTTPSKIFILNEGKGELVYYRSGIHNEE